MAVALLPAMAVATFVSAESYPRDGVDARMSMHRVGRQHGGMSEMSTCTYKTVWPSGLRRWLQAPVRKGVGSNPTAVIAAC